MAGREFQLIGRLEDGRLLGLIEIVMVSSGTKRRGEIGVSVAPGRRDLGMGHVLVQRAMDYAANRGLPLAFGHLPDNPRIPRIARHLGGHIDRRQAAAEIVPAPISASTLGLAAIDNIGRHAADAMALWKSAPLARLGAP
jgi:GNAT superfamily N-acetyltransferase